MPRIKAKPIRLIDVLNTINENEFVKITHNHGRSTYSNTSVAAEEYFKDYLGAEVKALTSSGSVQIFI